MVGAVPLGVGALLIGTRRLGGSCWPGCFGEVGAVLIGARPWIVAFGAGPPGCVGASACAANPPPGPSPCMRGDVGTSWTLLGPSPTTVRLARAAGG